MGVTILVWSVSLAIIFVFACFMLNNNMDDEFEANNSSAEVTDMIYFHKEVDDKPVNFKF